MAGRVKIVPEKRRVVLEASVKNVEGTSEDKCSICGSWLKHWENLSGKKAGKCARVGCKAAATDGAHVYWDGNVKKVYIVPLCHKCNIAIKDEFDIEDDITPVSVEHR